MTWLLKDFELLSVLLRALSFALEALALGGLAFLLLVALPSGAGEGVLRSTRRAGSLAALGLALSQAAAVSLSGTLLVYGSGLTPGQAASADFVHTGVFAVGCALALAFLLRTSSTSSSRSLSAATAGVVAIAPALGVLAASVAGSHAAAQLEHRALLSILTAMHHLGMALWVGAMLPLLLALRQPALALPAAVGLARRYSWLAFAGVALLVAGGVGLSYLYIGAWSGLYGTSYGVMVMAKTWLLLTMLLLGASNQRLLHGRGRRGAGAAVLLRVRGFAEVELALGFTALLAAASLTSQAPAVDLQPGDRLSAHGVVERLRWQTPRLASPPLAALAPPSTLQAALVDQQYGAGSASDANDRAWSEYNHHWAGLIVLAAGVLALVSRVVPGRWAAARRLAQAWPLLFLGLAVFILLRADPENWPLGPRPFWASFSRPDVLEHRLYAVLIAGFAFFEWRIEGRAERRAELRVGRGDQRRAAAYVFPLVCAAGGGVLLTHSHALGDMREEMLAELSHTAIALLGATAGWARWLELRLPESRSARMAARVWPLCLALAGLVLLDYREA